MVQTQTRHVQKIMKCYKKRNISLIRRVNSVISTQLGNIQRWAATKIIVMFPCVCCVCLAGSVSDGQSNVCSVCVAGSVFGQRNVCSVCLAGSVSDGQRNVCPVSVAVSVSDGQRNVCPASVSCAVDSVWGDRGDLSIDQAGMSPLSKSVVVREYDDLASVWASHAYDELTKSGSDVSVQSSSAYDKATRLVYKKRQMRLHQKTAWMQRRVKRKKTPEDDVMLARLKQSIIQKTPASSYTLTLPCIKYRRLALTLGLRGQSNPVQ